MRAVILNDTSYRNHHGCRTVMESLKKSLSERDIQILGTSYVGQNWKNNPDFLQQLKACDLVVINGEGTLHHGRDNAKMLLDVLHHPFTEGKKKVLLNSLYEENPDEWKTYLEKCDVLGLRDHASFKHCRDHLGLPLSYETSDLSLSHATPWEKKEYPRNGIAVGDSIVKEKKRVLLDFYKKHRKKGAVLMPVASSKKYPDPARMGMFYRLDQMRFYTKTFAQNLMDRNILYYPDAEKFLQSLAQKKLHITGRFHGVCLSLKTETPFLALASNSKKIENLLEQIGLQNRIIENLDDTILSRNWDFSPDEKQKISNYISWAQNQWKGLFTKIAP